MIRSEVINKFLSDKEFVSYDHIIVATDGVVLNWEEIAENQGMSRLADIISSAYDTDSLCDTLKQLRGSFAGVVYDKNKKSIVAYVDQFATKTLFYYQNNNYFIVASDVSEICRINKAMGMPIELDLVGAYSLLSYGYMLGNRTIIKGVYRLKEGELLSYKEGQINLKKYYKFNFLEKQISFDDAINKIDQLFTRAVMMHHKKNIRNGYIDVVPLSAGMDCRMTSYVLRANTSNPIINFTYSETGQYDEIVPSVMAKEQKNKWIFKSLDNGLDLENIDEAICLSDTLIKYDWPAQLIDFLKTVDTSCWGIISTGVIGDVIIGCFEKSSSMHRDYRIGDGAFSSRLINKLKKIIETEKELPVLSYEEGMMSNRAINGACLGYSRTFRHFAEDMSPFMNVDFAEFCFSLPLEYSRNHNIYYEWVKKKYPQAAKHKHNGIRIDGNLKIRYHGRSYRIKSLFDVIRNKVKRDLIKTGYGMNPEQTWYDNNSSLKRTMDDYFSNHSSVLNQWDELKKDVEDLYVNGSAVEKILAISLVGNIYSIFA